MSSVRITFRHGGSCITAEDDSLLTPARKVKRDTSPSAADNAAMVRRVAEQVARMIEGDDE